VGAVTERLRLREDRLEWRLVENEIVALDLRQSLYLAVNQTGTTLWPGLVEGETRDQLLARLTRRFDVPKADAERDVDAFVSDLRARGLLEE
jgi:coenzyme PQQ synthesis protein D (PqqD)